MQGEVEEMGRKVMVLQQRVNKSRRDSQDEMQQTSARQLMGDASTPLEVEDLTKVQKILDIFDVISQTVCDSEENQAGSSGSGSGNKLMAEIVSLRAGQLALIQDDHDQTVGCVEEVKKAFYSLGYRRCHGLLDRVVTLTLMEKTAHSERKTRMEQAAQLHSQEAIKQHHGKRGDRILLYARESLKNSRFDHALAFIVKAKRAYGQSDRENAAEMLEDLNRTVVMEATRMASDSLILEATRKSSTNPAPRRNSSGNLPSLQPSTRSTASDMSEATVASEASTELQDPHSATPREKDEVEALFSPSDATSKLFERIDMGGKVTLSQEQVELEDEIQRLRAGLEAKKSQMQDDVVPLHRKSYDAPAKPPVAMSSPLKPAVDDTPNVPSNGAGKPLSVETLLSSSYAPVDKELAPPISARKESRISWDFPDIDQALLKATNVCDGGMVGTAMVFLCLW